ncbi:MAG TPA: signal peptidase I, partial [Burkholderiales bacterium]|nr:signal peptidase I [Burkholderiales bacterium]
NRLAFDLKIPLTDIVVAHLGEPKRGDIVTFSSPRDGVRLIKRLVAVPGDTVAMSNKVLVVNGQPATYAPIGTVVEQLAPGTTVHALRLNEITGSGEHVVQWFHLPDGSEEDNFGPIVLPAGRYLMLGDNRDDSADSRYFGLVPRELLIGRAVAIVVSANIKGNWAPRLERFGERLR